MHTWIWWVFLSVVLIKLPITRLLLWIPFRSDAALESRAASEPRLPRAKTRAAARRSRRLPPRPAPPLAGHGRGPRRGPTAAPRRPPPRGSVPPPRAPRASERARNPECAGSETPTPDGPLGPSPPKNVCLLPLAVALALEPGRLRLRPALAQPPLGVARAARRHAFDHRRHRAGVAHDHECATSHSSTPNTRAIIIGVLVFELVSVLAVVAVVGVPVGVAAGARPSRRGGFHFHRRCGFHVADRGGHFRARRRFRGPGRGSRGAAEQAGRRAGALGPSSDRISAAHTHAATPVGLSGRAGCIESTPSAEHSAFEPVQCPADGPQTATGPDRAARRR